MRTSFRAAAALMRLAHSFRSSSWSPRGGRHPGLPLTTAASGEAL
jgi:hypothetical protein